MKKPLLMLTVLLFVVLRIQAQDRTISGKVTSIEDGTALPGVNVIIKGTATGTVTDIDGNYTLRVPSQGTVLVFSFIGLATKEVPVTGSNVIDIQMSMESTQLTEIVVVGYGQQEKRDVSGSIASVKGDIIQDLPVQSFDRAIQGRAAGVQVTSSGVPGGIAQIRVRGVGSINAGVSPLYIVDGVQVTSGDQSQLIASSNTLASLNPNDIESIEVLKDAAAASIYGAQAANGVVLITTKRGKTGKTQFNLNVSQGWMQQLNKLDVLNGQQFVDLTLEAYTNRFGADSPEVEAIRDNIAGFTDPNNAETYDWQDAVFRSGLVQNYELTASGGNEFTRFFISGSYNDTETHVIGTDFNRGTFRINLDQKASDKLSFNTSINLSSFGQRVPTQGGFFSNPNRSAHLIVPINSIYNEDGTFNSGRYWGGDANSAFFGSYDVNVVQDALANEVTSRQNSALANISADYEIVKGLRFKSAYSLDYVDIRETSFQDPRTRDGQTGEGQIEERDRKITNWSTDQTLTYTRTFNDKHEVTGLVGVFFRSSQTESFSAEGRGLPSFKLRTLQNAANPFSLTASYTIFKTNGVFFRGDYQYNDKYIFSGTVRRDGHSRFGAENRFGVFPAASVAWRISAEDFMGGARFVDDLKLRFSYGVTGNSAIGNFDSRGLYGTGGEYFGRAGLQPSRIANPLLTWEEATTANYGIDFSLFNGRLGGSLEYFRKESTDLLLDRPIPRTTGFSTITQNLGSLENTGFEISINSTNLIIGDFRWRTDFNITFLNSEVLSLTAESDTLFLGNSGSTYIVGEKVNAFMLQEFAGINPADGRPMWYDQNNNLTYNRTSGITRMYRGSAIPDHFGGLTNSFSYKGFTLTTFFQWQYGNLVLNGERGFTERAGSTADRNQNVSQLRRWQQPGDVTDVAMPVVNFAYPNGGASRFNIGNDTRAVERGDYLRLKEVRLSYQLPQALVNRIGLRSVNIYAIGVNLWTLTEYTGFDPEFIGQDFGDLPQPKTGTIGVNIGL
ncbi:MAG: TonB-dependent receptor [Bacteroidota bacterium]